MKKISFLCRINISQKYKLKPAVSFIKEKEISKSKRKNILKLKSSFNQNNKKQRNEFLRTVCLGIQTEDPEIKWCH